MKTVRKSFWKSADKDTIKAVTNPRLTECFNSAFCGAFNRDRLNVLVEGFDDFPRFGVTDVVFVANLAQHFGVFAARCGA